MHRETAPKDGKSVLLNEEDATGNSDAAPGKDHLRQRHASSFFLVALQHNQRRPATSLHLVRLRLFP